MYTRESLEKLIIKIDEVITEELQLSMIDPALYDNYSRDLLNIKAKLTRDLLFAEVSK